MKTVIEIVGNEEKREKDFILIDENDNFIAFWGYAASGFEKENFSHFEQCEVKKVIEKDKDTIVLIL